ncbi:MAG: hypothetical protein J6040_02180 [Clostridiales bacterium]|nr:hypothetical protein [Clostridiales bacterium]
MKKAISLVLSVALMSSLLLCGCKKSEKETEKETKERNSVVQSDSEIAPTETEADEGKETEASTTREQPHLDKDKLEQVAAYVESKRTPNWGALGIYADDIRGGCRFYLGDEQILFLYDSVDNEFSISVNIMIPEEKISCRFDFGYGEEDYSGATKHDIGLADLEEFIDNAAAGNTDAFEVYYDEALVSHAADIQKDLPIVYSRMIALAGNAFPELGFGLEDLGIDFGDKYRKLDPTILTTQETEIVNDHYFVNGVCADCNMLWTEYFYESAEKVDLKEYGNGGYTFDGQSSSALLEGCDYVRLSADSEKSASLTYDRMELYDDVHRSEEFQIEMFGDHGTIRSSIRVTYDDGYNPGGSGPTYVFEYELTLSANAGEYNKVFASKEAFAKCCNVELIYQDADLASEDELYKDLWQIKSDSEIEELFNQYTGCKYYSKEEFIDLIWEQHENILESMDNSMVWLDTCLEDAGINWK